MYQGDLQCPDVANDAPLPPQCSLLLTSSSTATTAVTFALALLQCEAWRLSTVNADYSVCPTYPPAVIVPKSVDDDTLRTVARFRQGGRFPVLCYYHQKNGMVRRLATLPLPSRPEDGFWTRMKS